ncbi:MAG: 2-amino-4-hydroxy-6-hydroxymethyldihydropteridine diphosphokinase [Arcobacter sp.]|nr:MAG: 2-amino-4-hydroxy-6-hydroxymethyldihydropteridine diphosphokinase [Arcobacter sp.]
MLEKSLNEELTLYKSKQFPRFFKDSAKRYSVTLGLGGNIGDLPRRLERLNYFFKRSILCDLIKTGPILKNPPFGYIDQDDFYNTVIMVKTNLQPRAFLKYVLEVERKFGRKRSFANAPRTLDIDIIFYENRKMKSKILTLPHPCWQERESVVIPMAYMEQH